MPIEICSLITSETAELLEPFTNLHFWDLRKYLYVHFLLCLPQLIPFLIHDLSPGL
jgi:hypothetical protein